MSVFLSVFDHATSSVVAGFNLVPKLYLGTDVERKLCFASREVQLRVE